VYGSWGSTQVQRGDQWASSSRVTNRATGTTTRGTQTSGGGEAVTRRGPSGTSGVARTGSGDVYAGRDGNVYKKQDGNWQKYDNGNWGNVDRPQPTGQAATQARDRSTTGPPASSSTMDNLNRDYSARTEGRQRTSDYSSYRSSGGSGSSGSSYRSSGGSRGGGRGGGGRRR
jgi:hypothetical protein